MAGRRTIAELEQQVRWQSDQEEAELRHTSKEIRRIINQSIRRFRQFASDVGYQSYLKQLAFKCPVGPDKAEDGETLLAWNTFDLDSVDPGVVRIYGIDVNVNNTITELNWNSFTQRNKYSYPYSQNGPPLSYCVYDETKLAFSPPSDSPYNMVLWYLPEYPELVNDEDEFNPQIPGADEWVVWDALQKIAVRDNYGPMGNTAKRYKDELMAEINHFITSGSRTTPGRRLDTRGRRLGKNNFRFWSNTTPSGQ